jgi:hypothetical protein
VAPAATPQEPGISRGRTPGVTIRALGERHPHKWLRGWRLPSGFSAATRARNHASSPPGLRWARAYSGRRSHLNPAPLHPNPLKKRLWISVPKVG